MPRGSGPNWYLDWSHFSQSKLFLGAEQSGPIQTLIIFHMQYFPNALFVPLLWASPPTQRRQHTVIPALPTVSKLSSRILFPSCHIVNIFNPAPGTNICHQVQNQCLTHSSVTPFPSLIIVCSASCCCHWAYKWGPFCEDTTYLENHIWSYLSFLVFVFFMLTDPGSGTWKVRCILNVLNIIVNPECISMDPGEVDAHKTCWIRNLKLRRCNK